MSIFQGNFYPRRAGEFQEIYLLGKERAVSARSWLALRWRHKSMLMMRANSQTGLPALVAFLM